MGGKATSVYVYHLSSTHKATGVFLSLARRSATREASEAKPAAIQHFIRNHLADLRFMARGDALTNEDRGFIRNLVREVLLSCSTKTVFAEHLLDV